MKWIKNNGQEIETNDLEATIEHCLKLGWTPEDDEITEDELNKIAKEGYDALRKDNKDTMPIWSQAPKQEYIEKVKAYIENPVNPEDEFHLAVDKAIKLL